MTEQLKRDNTGKRKTSGRPKKNIKRDRIIMVRLTVKEKLLLKRKALKAGLSLSEWFRLSAMKAVIVPRFSPEEMSCLRMLSGLANNLNQLTRQSYTYGLHLLEVDIQQLLKRVEITLDQLSSK